MAISVTDIKGIASFPNTVSEASIQDAITVAEIVLHTCEIDKVGLSQYIYETIQKYLAAHFCLLSAGGEPVAIKTGESQVTFSKEFGMGLKMTSYGQMALSIDPTGLLSKMNTKTEGKYRAVSISFVGSK